MGRYNQETKDEVIAFIQQYNEENGRGGQSAAVKKWNLNPVTVKSWLAKAGVETPGRGGRKKAKAGRPKKVARKARAASPRKSVAAPAAGDLETILNRMVAVRQQIADLEKEYAQLKALL
jgi:hypothetical protein